MELVRARRDRAAAFVLGTAAMLSVGTTFTIAGLLFVEALRFFRTVPIDRVVFSSRFSPLLDPAGYGVWPLLAGSALVAVWALGLALPVALLIAIYLAEYCPPRARSVIKVVLDVLAGVPSLVFGFLALRYVSPLLQHTVDGIGPYSAFAGSIVLAAMIVPYIATLADDAIYSVPLAAREAGHALGGTKLAVIRRVVLPNATSGIVAAAFLGVARAIGETMIVLIVCGLQPALTFDPRAAVETLAGFIGQAALSDASASETGARLLYFVGAVLFVVTFALNAISARLRRRFLRRSP